MAESVGLHDGACIPFHMFAKVAVATGKHGAWIDGAEAFKKWVRRHARIALAALVANLGVFGGYVVHRIAATAAAEERAIQVERAWLERRDNMEREISDLRTDIRELRAAMRRLSGGDIPRSDSIDEFREPEGKLSDLRDDLQDAGKMFAAAASAVAHPFGSCGRLCNSSVECTSLVPSCKFCNFGECKATRPEDPVPIDAGVPDAPGGTR